MRRLLVAGGVKRAGACMALVILGSAAAFATIGSSQTLAQAYGGAGPGGWGEGGLRVRGAAATRPRRAIFSTHTPKCCSKRRIPTTRSRLILPHERISS